MDNIIREILKIIEDKSRVLDLGCGDGELIYQLMELKEVYGLGIDINTEQVLKCIKRGVSVIQEDIDSALEQYQDKSYDYVVLSETLQALKKPDYVLNQIVRIGNKAIIAFPNFGYYRIRLQLLFTGRMPKNRELPYDWYNTPNIHLLTIKDFKEFCAKNSIKILKEIYHSGEGKKKVTGPANLFAEEAIFLIQKR